METDTQKMIQEENEILNKEKLLVDLSKTKTWEAIVWYLGERKKLAENSFRTLDPFKEPTQVARNQGILQGLDDLTQYVAMLNEKAKAEKEDE